VRLLHVDASITGVHSVSWHLSAAIVSYLVLAIAHLEVVRRDLFADVLPMFDAETLAGMGVQPQRLSDLLGLKFSNR